MTCHIVYQCGQKMFPTAKNVYLIIVFSHFVICTSPYFERHFGCFYDFPAAKTIVLLCVNILRLFLVIHLSPQYVLLFQIIHQSTKLLDMHCVVKDNDLIFPLRQSRTIHHEFIETLLLITLYKP